MSAADRSAEAAFREALEQLQMRAVRQDRWSSRAVFWTAVRFGVDQVLSSEWGAARERWARLWAVAIREHLPPIPGVPEVTDQPVTASVALQGIAAARAIVGKRR